MRSYIDKETLKVYGIGCGGLIFGVFAFIVICAIVIGIFSAGWVWFNYNSLVNTAEDVTEAWQNIDVVLVKRSDLIPNLVETVKGYAKHEKDTLIAVIEARSKATSVQLSGDNLINNLKSISQSSALQSQFSSALSRLMLVMMVYLSPP